MNLQERKGETLKTRPSSAAETHGALQKGMLSEKNLLSSSLKHFDIFRPRASWFFQKKKKNPTQKTLYILTFEGTLLIFSV